MLRIFRIDAVGRKAAAQPVSPSTDSGVRSAVLDPSTGLNDDLNSVERPVSFDILETGATAQVVHSLAKWKRYALYRYGFQPGYGLVTDMNAIRRDEELDNLHSVYVDQWDWEAIIPQGRQDAAFLRETVQKS